jgi:hypothetical protein
MRFGISSLFVGAVLGVASVAPAQVTGKVKLDGKPPAPKEIDMSGVKECAALHADPVMDETIVAKATGELANVVVSVKAEEAAALGGAIPEQPAVLDQKGCQYVPHVLPMMVGQKLKIKNSDAFLHNVHSLAQTNPAFNFGQPNKDPGKDVDPPKTAEVIKIKCDVHPWMGAWQVVFEHPFFAASKEDGTFEIKGLPDGDYTLEAWHEKLGKQEGKVSVKGGKGTADFTFKLAGASAEPTDAAVLAKLGESRPAQTVKAGECCETAAPAAATPAPGTPPACCAAPSIAAAVTAAAKTP